MRIHPHPDSTLFDLSMAAELLGMEVVIQLVPRVMSVRELAAACVRVHRATGRVAPPRRWP